MISRQFRRNFDGVPINLAKVGGRTSLDNFGLNSRWVERKHSASGLCLEKTGAVIEWPKLADFLRPLVKGFEFGEPEWPTVFGVKSWFIHDPKSKKQLIPRP